MINYNIHTDRFAKVFRDALVDDILFKDFRRHPDCRQVCEGLYNFTGARYLLEIKNTFPFLLQCMSDFAAGDTVGNPQSYHYNINKRQIDISPTTLRYIKVLADLMGIFGSLNDMDIVEIGSGYGGQCKIINDIQNPISYTLIDLPDVLALSEKYLKLHNVENFKLRDIDDTSSLKYDLCISNYAFTEVGRNYQDIYSEKIIRMSTRGYITCNFLGERVEEGALSKEDILLLHDGKFMPEKPKTGVNNIIYIWGV